MAAPPLEDLLSTGLPKIGTALSKGTRWGAHRGADTGGTAMYDTSYTAFVFTVEPKETSSPRFLRPQLHYVVTSGRGHRLNGP